MKTHKINIRLKDEEILSHMKTLEFFFSIPGRPEAYARERYSGRIKKFYNKKGGKMTALKKEILKQLKNEKQMEIMKELISDKDNFYYVEFDMKFFIPVPINDSKKMSLRKTSGMFRPTQRPDIDNYGKFIFDSFHGVFYDDDCRIVKESSEKLFGEEGKSEIKVKITYYENEE